MIVSSRGFKIKDAPAKLLGVGVRLDYESKQYRISVSIEGSEGQKAGPDLSRAKNWPS